MIFIPDVPKLRGTAEEQLLQLYRYVIELHDSLEAMLYELEGKINPETEDRT